MNAKKKGRKVCTVQSLTEQTHLYRQQKMGPLSWNQAEGAPAAWCLCCFQESDCIFVFAAIGCLWAACCRAQSPRRDVQHRVFWPVEAGIAPGNGQQRDKRQGNRLQHFGPTKRLLATKCWFCSEGCVADTGC